MQPKNGNLDVWARLSKDRLTRLSTGISTDGQHLLSDAKEAERITSTLILPAFEEAHNFLNTSKSLSILVYPFIFSGSSHLLAIETQLCMEASVFLVLGKIPCPSLNSISENVWHEVEHIAPSHKFSCAGTYWPKELGLEMKMFEMLLGDNLA